MEEIKSKWKNLRDKYVRERKKEATRKDNYVACWRFMNQFSFIDDIQKSSPSKLSSIKSYVSSFQPNDTLESAREEANGDNVNSNDKLTVTPKTAKRKLILTKSSTTSNGLKRLCKPKFSKNVAFNLNNRDAIIEKLTDLETRMKEINKHLEIENPNDDISIFARSLIRPLNDISLDSLLLQSTKIEIMNVILKAQEKFMKKDHSTSHEI